MFKMDNENRFEIWRVYAKNKTMAMGQIYIIEYIVETFS